MTESDLREILGVWKTALTTLAEVVSLDETPVVRDAAIKRFEYNFELAWKCVKHCALAEGEGCNSPKSAFKVAFKLGWIKDEGVWLDMLDDRNQTTHTYKEATACVVYAHIRTYLSALSDLHDALHRSLAN
jgi:nucleotidyltransferase substrate binding protein (TIGR01987 family)